MKTIARTILIVAALTLALPQPSRAQMSAGNEPQRPSLKTSRFQHGEVLGRIEIGLCEGNRSHIDKKRPTDLSIAKRLGGFY